MWTNLNTDDKVISLGVANVPVGTLGQVVYAQHVANSDSNIFIIWDNGISQSLVDNDRVDTV